jgi:hypothetical protein
MKPIDQHPVLSLAALGILSGFLGTFALDFGYGEAPRPGIYMILAGLWFGLVVAFGVWTWGERSWTAAAAALAATWIAWEVAVNLALQLDGSWLEAALLPEAPRSYASGFAAGAVGALLVWGGAALFTPALQRLATAALVVSAGAVLGLLMPWTNHYDSPAVLLLPWQAGVAAALGFGLAPARSLHRPGGISPARM